MTRIFLFTLLFITTTRLIAQQSEIFSKHEGAINGYDAVTYFKESKPVKGKKEYTHQWNGTTWYFASQQNLNDFKKQPEKYAPQYGGYCAYGMSNGYKALLHRMPGQS